MIVKIKKTKIKPAHIEITSSTTSDFFNLNSCSVPYDTVVASNSYVYLVTNTKEAEVLNRMNHLTDTLPSINLKMRTGLIVDFRAKNILRNENEVGSFPLFYSQHIKDGKIVWPQGRSGEYIHTNHFAYLQKNSNYLFVKRFTSKEERRRLQCGIYLSSEYPEYKYISTQNKINFIQCESKNLVFGLYVLLNSSLYDDYYRILNGSTQVNSTEVNSMPVPKKTIIESMGRELMGKDLSERNCNTIIDKWIR
jgi:adenine-specific DNA-methyltransferase